MRKLVVCVILVLGAISWLIWHLANAEKRWFEGLTANEKARIEAMRQEVKNLQPKSFVVFGGGRVFLVVGKSGIYIQVKESILGVPITISPSYEVASKIRVVKPGDPEYDTLILRFWNAK